MVVDPYGRRHALNRARVWLVAAALLFALTAASPLVQGGGAAVPGLVAAYSFDDGSGTSVTDSSGAGNAGTITGAVWTAAGKFGPALSFDGTSDWVTVPDAPSLDLSGPETLEAWVNPSTLGAVRRTVVGKENTTELAYGLYANTGMSTTAGGFGLDAVSETIVRGEIQLPLNAWSHLAFTYDGSTLRLYENGVQVSSLAWSGAPPLSGQALRIGGNAPKGEYFAGKIDEVRVYNRALSASEVQSDMTTGIGLPVPVDTQPPTSPDGMAFTGTTQSSISLSWNASTDNIAVTGYNVYLNGSKVATTANTSYTYTGLNCGTSYTVALEAVDAAGNTSNRAEATGTTSTQACAVADTQPPTVPDGMAWSGTTQTTIGLVWTASSDNVGVAGYRLYKNGAVAATTTNLSYTFTGLTCGTSYTIALEAYDAAGNVSNKAMATGTTSTSPCSNADTTPPSAPANLTASASSETSISSSWSASSDNVGVAGYNVYDGATRVASTTATSASITGLLCGTTHTIGVEAYDAAGNVSTRATKAASTAACSGGGGGGGGTASLFLSPSGSDGSPCTAAAPCRNFQRAYDLAAAGAIVQLAGGSYGSQSISGSHAAPAVVFRPAAGASVSLGGLDVHADNLEIRDMSASYWLSYAESDGFTARNLNVSFIQIYGSSHISVVGGDMGPSYTPGGNSTVSYITYGANGTVAPTNVLIDGAYFHDFRRGSVADHMECLMVVGGNGITIRNSKWQRCDIFNIFFTQWAGPNPPKNVLLENNFFNATTTDGNPGGTSLALQFSGHMNQMEGYTVRNNSLVMPLGIDSPPVGVTIVGNAMAFSGCVGGVTYAYNVVQDDLGVRCGSTDEIVSGPRYATDRLGFVNPGGGDLHLTSTSPAIDSGSPTNFSATDIDGQARPMGARADAGADERQ
jgi:chitodextrinase